MKTLFFSLVAMSTMAMAATTPEQCQVAFNGRVSGQVIYKTQGDGFYNQASQQARSSGYCVKANLLGSESSVRVYQGGSGKRLSSKGASEYSSVAQYANAACLEMTCVPVYDSKAQTDYGHGTGGYVTPGVQIDTPANPAPVVIVPVGSGE